MLNRKKLLSLFVAALMLLTTVFTGIAPAFAEDAEEPNDPVVTEPAGEEPEESEMPAEDPNPESEEETAEEPEETESEEIDPDLDTDGDGVPDVDEITFGTDPENADTDGDGLSDYDELYVYYTAAGEKDSDGDGLSDYDEVHVYGTDPVKGDTDADGLSDGDELKQGTNPKNPDTDGDGILDGDELILGTDPLKAEDISAVFQSSDGLVDGVRIEGYAPFVLFREGVVMPYGVDSFLNNPALVGTPVEIRLPEGGDLTLKLTVKSSAKEIAIFRMNENGTVRLDAAKSGKTFSLPLEENGVYYAADLQKLNVLLGFEGAGMQSLPENSYLLEDFRTVTLSAPLQAGSDVDTDGDGIPDCEEIGEQYAIDLGNGYTATVYGYVSDPTLVDSDFDGIRDDLDTLPRSNNFSATYKSGDFTINLTYSMDYRDFLGDNTVYNAAIASFSVWAAQLAYDNDITFTPGETLYDSDGSVITNARRIDTLMRAHGMQNVIDYQLENGYFDSDISLSAYSDDNITEVFFGHHKVADDDGKEYEIITVFVRGTNGTEKEWCSNFDVGDLHRYLDDYDCVEGKQPRQLNADWNRKSNHRGFDMCATRIYRALAAYMNKFVDSEATPVFWLAGHSRGAAIANIVSASCVDEGHKVFAYTYASPNTTANTEASAAKYDCIFNLVNGDDFVPMLPMPEWGFTRYGRSATIAAHNASSSQRSSILNTTSYSYSDDLGSLVAKFTNMTKNNNNVVEGWWDVYVYHCKSSDTVGSYHTHNGETVGEYRDGSRKSYFTDSNWNDYNEHTKKYSYCIRDGNGWINKYSCCQTPAYAMQLLAITMGNLGLSAGWSFLTSYDLADRFDFGKTSLITNYATKIADPHYMENYYLIQKALLSEPDTTFNTNNSLYTNASHRPQHTHSYEIIEIKQAPTCTEPGVAHVICHCSSVNSAWYDDEIKNALIPATGHNYGTPAWTWDGLTEATATFTCANDGTHVETRSTTDIVRTENGDLAVYTATVEFEGETYTDTKTVEIGYYLIGSMTDWEVDETYRFTANAAAQGEYLLNVADLAIGAEIKVVRAEGATKLNWYPDYGGNYTVDYPHSGNVNVYFRPAGNVWNDFFTGGYFYISRLHTAEVIAVGGGEASLDPASPDVTATVTVVVPANAGYHYNYVEIYKRTGAGENDLEQIELGSLDWNDTNRTFTMPDYDVVIKVYFAAHTWSEPTYTWEAEGEGWKCTATRECTTEGCDAVETETVTATYAVTTDPTCEDAGVGTYTATFENEAFETQTKTVDLDPIGHDWDTPTYTWDENNNCTAERVCKNDATHKETELAPGIGEVTKPATCEEAGETTYTATFANEAFETQTKVVADVEPIGHDWDEPTYEWAADNSTVTATRVCKNDESHVETETVNTTSEVKTPATCEGAGTTTYTATFENEAFETQTKDVEDIDPIGHDWDEPTYEWAADNSTVTATRVCKNDESHIETETVNTTSEVKMPATCEGAGTTTYTATFENEAFETQTKDVEDIEPIGHDWDEPTYEWAADNSTVTATRVCKNDESHVETETVNTTSEVKTPATCEGAGTTTYTATFENEAFETQTKDVEDIEPIGHDWDEPTYEWATDNSTVTATRVCKNDESHVETETVNTTSEVKTPATCEGAGTTTYTATFENEAFEKQTKDVEDIEPIGHDWILVPTWAWEGVESATATFVCRNDETHVETLDAEITSEVDGDYTVYTATVEFQGETFTDEKRVPLGPAFMTQSLLLEGKIGVRFYVRLPEIEGYEYTGVDFTITGKGGEDCATTVPFSSDLPTNTKGYYGFTYYVGTIQMADTITATLNYTVDGEAQTLEKAYSVKEYFEAFDANYAAHPELYSDDIVNLIKATADLGHYVQAYLDEARSEWSIANGDHAAMDKVYTTDIEAYLEEATTAVASHALNVTGGCSDIKSLNYALLMDSEMTIRVTIVPAKGFTGTFTATVDGESVEVTKLTKSKYMVEIKNVQAHQLSTEHTIVIGTEDGGSYTLIGSGLSFVKMMLTAYAGNDVAINAAIAVYRYSKFADVVHGDPADINKTNGNSSH